MPGSTRTLNRRGRDQVLGLADGALRDRLGRDGRGLRRARRAWAAIRADVDGNDRRPDVGCLALGHQQVSDDACVRARQLDDRLGGLDLDDDLVNGDLVTRLDVPSDDVGLGQAFPDVRELELLEI